MISLLEGRDTLVVQPTGSGKSAIYQLAGLLIDGPTIIISPLIALQKDQVDSIEKNDLANAALVNSQQRVSSLRETFEKLENDKLEYLFLAPEQLHREETMERLKANPPSHAEEIAQALTDRGINAASYHGGMPDKERNEIQRAFMIGEIPVIAATNAFGMGVDKSDVRFVFHFDIPDSIDSYYQEIGRAGRDGAPADAVLFYRPEDLRVPKFLKSGGKIDEQEALQVQQTIEDADEPVAIEDLQESTRSWSIAWKKRAQ